MSFVCVYDLIPFISFTFWSFCIYSWIALNSVVSTIYIGVLALKYLTQKFHVVSHCGPVKNLTGISLLVPITHEVGLYTSTAWTLPLTPNDYHYHCFFSLLFYIDFYQLCITVIYIYNCYASYSLLKMSLCSVSATWRSVQTIDISTFWLIS